MNRARHNARSRLLALICLLAVPIGSVAQSDHPGNYFQLGEDSPVPGHAPGLAVNDLGRITGVTELSMKAGDEVMSGLLDYVRAHKPKAGVLTGIGGFQSAVFAWYDPVKKAFKRIPVDMKGEVVAFTGSVAYRDGRARVHVHAIMSLADGTTRGGHLVSAKVSPIMQVFILRTDR